MAKKLLSVLVVVAMLFSVVSVCAVAVDNDPAPEKGYDWDYDLPYDASHDYRQEFIDFMSNGLDDFSRADEGGPRGCAEYIGDPDVCEYTMQFMNDEAIAWYERCKASGNNHDWYELVNEVCHSWRVLPRDDMSVPFEDEDLLYGYYPYYLDNSKVVFQVKFVADKQNVEPGEQVTVSVYFKSNVYSYNYVVGIIYDKTLCDLTSATTPVPLRPSWTVTGRSNYNYGYVDGAVEPILWPSSMRNQESYNKWGMALDVQRADILSDDFANYIDRTVKVDDWALFNTYTFTVKADAPQGSELRFWLPHDGTCGPTFDQMRENEEYATYVRLCQCLPSTGPKSTVRFWEGANYDNTYLITDSVVSVGSAAPAAADYTALDAAINAFDADEAGLYKAAGWTAYANAVAAGQQVDRNLTADDQATVDAAATAITEARAALQLKSVINAVASEAVIGSDSTVTIKADEGATNIRLAGQSGTLTFARDEAVITAGANGTETWTVKVLADSERADYMVYAKFGGTYTENGVALTVIGTQGADTSILGLSVAGMYPAGTTNGGTLIKGKHQVVVKTSTDVSKVQFVAENKTTCTYDMKTAQYSDEDGVRTWVLSFNFSRFGDCVYTIRTRTPSTTFADTGSTMTATVVY